MEKIIPMIRETAQRIGKAEEERKRLAGFLKTTQSRLSFPVAKDSLNKIRVAAVDGGIVKKSLHGFDFILARAAGVVFDYENGRVVNVNYHPSKIPDPELFVLEALSDIDWLHSTSIARQSLEVREVVEVMEKYGPQVMMMDGSIIPHYTDRPSRDSGVYNKYEILMDMYRGLYRKALESNVLLCGIVEDSRGIKFCSMIRDGIMAKNGDRELDKILEKTRDTNLLFWILNEGERTAVFPYSKEPKDHPVMREFPEFAGKLFSFYLKTAKFDRPVRVDFLGEESTVERIAGVVAAMSGDHSGYGIPSIIIEADQVAKMSEADMELIYDQVMAETGSLPSTFRLRRDSRPF